MVNRVLDRFKKIDELTYKIIKKGLKFCLMLCLVSISILLAYSMVFLSPTIYYIGLALFKLSCYFGVEFIVCGLAMDTIKKELI